MNPYYLLSTRTFFSKTEYQIITSNEKIVITFLLDQLPRLGDSEGTFRLSNRAAAIVYLFTIHGGGFIAHTVLFYR